MTAHQTALLAKADRALGSAHRTLEDGDADAAVNRAYYACFYVAQAALVGKGETPRTHSGTHNRFAFHFVASGLVSPTVARALPYAAQVRERADYEAFAVTDARAAMDLLTDVKTFVATVRELVR